MGVAYSFRSSMNGFNRNDVIAYIDTVLAEKVEIEKKVAELEKEIEELHAANDTLKEIIVDEEKKNEKELKNKCEECDLAKVYEARLGAAMLDAKRFSEILVKEANDKASGMFSKAYNSASDTLEKATEISEDIVRINKQFNDSFRGLLENMKSLNTSLDSFKCEVKKTGSSFDYKTDFTPAEKYNRNDSQSIIRQSVSDVNFDDADDFEIKVDN